MTVRNQYGDYNVWFRYVAGCEGRLGIADAGGEAFGVLSCFVHPDGTVEELGKRNAVETAIDLAKDDKKSTWSELARKK